MHCRVKRSPYNINAISIIFVNHDMHDERLVPPKYSAIPSIAPLQHASNFSSLALYGKLYPRWACSCHQLLCRGLVVTKLCLLDQWTVCLGGIWVHSSIKVLRCATTYHQEGVYCVSGSMWQMHCHSIACLLIECFQELEALFKNPESVLYVLAHWLQCFANLYLGTFRFTSIDPKQKTWPAMMSTVTDKVHPV